MLLSSPALCRVVPAVVHEAAIQVEHEAETFWLEVYATRLFGTTLDQTSPGPTSSPLPPPTPLLRPSLTL